LVSLFTNCQVSTLNGLEGVIVTSDWSEEKMKKKKIKKNKKKIKKK